MDWTAQELIAISTSRQLLGSRVVFAGVGVPLVAAVLAKMCHEPELTIVLEGGIIGPEIEPGELPVSTNEMRAARRATMLTDITDIFLYGQRGFYDHGLLGTAQIDQYGNLNTSIIGDVEDPKVRLPGTGGANDIISSCQTVTVATLHEPRRFVERVDFLTSPGHLNGSTSRADSGLIFGGPSRVVTDLGLMDFHPQTKRMRLIATQPGVSAEDVQRRTGFELLVADGLSHLEPPTDDELRATRALDPTGRHLR